MLVMLLPEQVSEYWGFLKGGIDDDPPPIADNNYFNINNILSALLAGSMQGWFVQEEGENVGFILTTILYDISGVNTLLIYSASIHSVSKKDSWLDAFDTLIKFGRHKGCTKIGAFIANEKLIKLAADSGYDTGFRFVNYDI